MELSLDGLDRAPARPAARDGIADARFGEAIHASCFMPEARASQVARTEDSIAHCHPRIAWHKPELEIVVGNWVFLVVLGILSIVVGVLAILNPFPASLVAVKLAGWAFLIIGGLQIAGGFRATGWGARIWALAIGVLALVAGINLLGEPLAGMVSLTIVLALLFLVSGLVKLIAAWQIKHSSYRLAVLVSGIASLLLGFIILSNFPISAVTSLGILLGVELISNGVSALALGWASKTGTA